MKETNFHPHIFSFLSDITCTGLTVNSSVNARDEGYARREKRPGKRHHKGSEAKVHVSRGCTASTLPCLSILSSMEFPRPFRGVRTSVRIRL